MFCFWISVFLLLGLLGMYGLLYAALLRQPKEEERQQALPGTPPGISVLLYTHNQLDTLRDSLSMILTQDYPHFEVIVIDDASDDGTHEWLIQTQQAWPQLHYTFVPQSTRYVNHRSLALLLGAKAARHDILLFTEADCLPTSDHWLASFAQACEASTELWIGCCRYACADPTLAQKRIAFDHLLQGVRLLVAAHWGHPYGGDGRNLAYRRSLFLRQPSALLARLSTQAGEQTRFVRHAAHRQNTLPLWQPESLTEQQPVDALTWQSIRQQLRLTLRQQRGYMPLLFRFESVAFLLFHVALLGTWLTALPTHWGYALGTLPLYLLRLGSRMWLFHRLALRLEQPPLTRWFPFLEWM